MGSPAPVTCARKAAVARSSGVGECTDVVEAEHPGRALDGVRIAKQRADGLGARIAGLDREQRRVHLIEPLRRLVTEELGEGGVWLAHCYACSSESNTRGTSITPMRAPPPSAGPPSPGA